MLRQFEGIVAYPNFLSLFRFSYVTAHSPNFPSLHLRRSSFSNPSVTLPTSQLILQPFRCFSYITTHSPTLLSLLLRHSSFSNLSVTSPMSKLILQPFCRFTYATVHSPTLPLLQLHHRTFSSSYFASPTSQALHLRHLASISVTTRFCCRNPESSFISFRVTQFKE